MSPVAINFVAAQSGTGKTTVIEKLLPELNDRGLKVAALKGEVHHYDLDIPGKDTWRFARAGAAVAGMTTPEKFILIGNATGGGTAAAIERLHGFDLIIIEGDRKSPRPKIEVIRSAVSTEPLLLEGTIALVTDLPALNLPQPLPLFGLEDAAGLANFIEDRFFKTRRP